MVRFSRHDLKIGVPVLVILILSFVMVACGSTEVPVAEIQTEEVKSGNNSQQIEQSASEAESSQENSPDSSEQSPKRDTRERKEGGRSRLPRRPDAC